ncbi:MAG: hypothetical protein V3U92_18120 [Cellulophaga sp.]
MQYFQPRLYDKQAKEFFYTGINLNLNWVVAFISSNEIKKNSIRMVLDKNIISGKPIERFYSKKYDLFLTQTTFVKILESDVPFFSLGKRLIINRKYSPFLIYNNNHKIIFNDTILDTPKWSRKKIIETLNFNSS